MLEHMQYIQLGKDCTADLRVRRPVITGEGGVMVFGFPLAIGPSSVRTSSFLMSVQDPSTDPSAQCWYVIAMYFKSKVVTGSIRVVLTSSWLEYGLVLLGCCMQQSSLSRMP